VININKSENIDDHTGLTLQEAMELLEYIQKNHSWENMFNIIHNTDVETLGYPKFVKYVRMSVDTRTGDVWSVEFDSDFGTDHYRTDIGYNLKDKLYSVLSERRKSNKDELRVKEKREL